MIKQTDIDTQEGCKKMFKIFSYVIVVYPLIALTVPEMSVWQAVKDTLYFTFFWIPLEGIFHNLFLVGEYFENLTDNGNWGWGILAALFYIFAGPLALMYYLTFVEMILGCGGMEIDRNSPEWQNEMYWMSGQTTTQNLIDAEVQANAIAKVLNDREEKERINKLRNW